MLIATLCNWCLIAINLNDDKNNVTISNVSKITTIGTIKSNTWTYGLNEKHRNCYI